MDFSEIRPLLVLLLVLLDILVVLALASSHNVRNKDFTITRALRVYPKPLMVQRHSYSS